MAVEVTIPRLGWNMDEGIFHGWLKEDGQAVKAGDPLFSLEGDKSTQDIESLESGVLRIPPDGPKPGETLAVGTVIGYLVVEGEAIPASGTSSARTTNAVVQKAEQPSAIAGFASELSSDSRSNRLRVSPRARRVADELGIDVSKLRGTGRTGRIRERDVRAFAESPGNGSRSATGNGIGKTVAQPGPEATGQFEVVPLSTMRRTIAQRMMQSTQATAPVTLTTSVDATNLVSLRKQFKAVSGASAPIGYTDIIVTLSAIAMNKHPMINAQWDSDRILISKEIHVGIAVDTDAGLIVPVIRDVPKLTLRQVAARSRELIDRARAGKLAMLDSQGSTFTVTNLGTFGIDAFTPVINPPECAILGMGRIKAQAVPVGDRFIAQDQMTLSLTFDHRIIDGAPAARFLQTLCEMIENPSPWLLP